MPTPFEVALTKMWELGFFQFILPFMLGTAVIYGLLRKSQIFGKPEENITVNGIIALAFGLFIAAYPIIVGVDVEKQFAMFFFQSLVSIVIVMAGLMVAGMFFPPDLPKVLGEKMKGGGLIVFIVLGLFIGGAVVFSSGIITIFFPNFGAMGLNVSNDTLLTIGIIILFMVTIGGVMWFVGRGEGKSSGGT